MGRQAPLHSCSANLFTTTKGFDMLTPSAKGHVPIDRYRFEGQADLGSLAGGLYHYEGYATLTNFYSTYRAQYDFGTFQMTRPTN